MHTLKGAQRSYCKYWGKTHTSPQYMVIRRGCWWCYTLDPSTSPWIPQETYLYGVSSLSFLPEGKRLSTSNTDGSVFIWGVLP
jgi:hypothetical protein